jgi:hypothetical protein
MNNALYKALYQIIFSLAKILLRKGIAFGEFSQLIKRAYIDVTEKQLLKSEGKATTSRITIVTGLTRKEVGNLRKQSKSVAPGSSKYNRAVRVISGWLEDTEFSSIDGLPKALPISGDKGSFEALVNRYSGDIPVRAMLDELERVKVIKKIGKQHISLLRHAYVPLDDEDETLSILGADVSELISTIDHNLTTDNKELHFQRKVSYDNLPAECLPEFQKMVNQDGQYLLEKFNEWLMQQDRDINPDKKGTGQIKAGVGIFYFEEPASETKSETKDPHEK